MRPALAVKSEFVDAMDAQASLLRFRPRSQNDGSERSEGECTPQVGLTSGSEGMREAQAYGIRFAAHGVRSSAPEACFFLRPRRPQPPYPAPPKKPRGLARYRPQGSDFEDLTLST